MKKSALFLLIATLLTSGLFAGCGESEDNPMYLGIFQAMRRWKTTYL